MCQVVIVYEKTATLNLRIDLEVKDRVESVITLLKVPDTINTDPMSAGGILYKIEKGYEGMKSGRTQNAAEAFAKVRKNYK